MVLLRSAVMLTFAMGIARDPGCNGVDTTSSGVNAPCTRDKDCNAGLLCTGGVCVSPDGGPIQDDAGVDAASTSDAAHD